MAQLTLNNVQITVEDARAIWKECAVTSTPVKDVCVIVDAGSGDNYSFEFDWGRVEIAVLPSIIRIDFIRDIECPELASDPDLEDAYGIVFCTLVANRA